MKTSSSLLKIGAVIATVGILIAVGRTMSNEIAPVHDAVELRKAIDLHKAALLELFPTLQGMATDAEQGGVGLTVRSESGIMNEAAMKEEAEALLGVPVKVRLLPVELRRQSPIQ